MSESMQVAKLQMQSKSMLIGLLLTLFFGGFGVFYFSTLGGIICAIIEIILWVVSFFTFGLGVLIVVPFHLICVIYTAIAINGHNKKLLQQFQ